MKHIQLHTEVTDLNRLILITKSTPRLDMDYIRVINKPNNRHLSATSFHRVHNRACATIADNHHIRANEM